MKSNFEKCLKVILQHEGGFVNHPKDPGGATNMGITKRTWERFIGKSVTIQDIKDLTFNDVKPVYEYQYWDRMKCDELPEGIDLVVFDFGVNAGTGRGARFLQEIVGAYADGAIGPKTLAKLTEWLEENTAYDFVKEYTKKRQDYYESLKTFSTFGRGWSRRNKETEEQALDMI